MAMLERRNNVSPEDPFRGASSMGDPENRHLLPRPGGMHWGQGTSVTKKFRDGFICRPRVTGGQVFTESGSIAPMGTMGHEANHVSTCHGKTDSLIHSFKNGASRKVTSIYK